MTWQLHLIPPSVHQQTPLRASTAAAGQTLTVVNSSCYCLEGNRSFGAFSQARDQGDCSWQRGCGHVSLLTHQVMPCHVLEHWEPWGDSGVAMPISKQRRENKEFLQWLGWTNFAEVLDWHPVCPSMDMSCKKMNSQAQGKKNHSETKINASFVNSEIEKKKGKKKLYLKMLDFTHAISVFLLLSDNLASYFLPLSS